MQPDRTEIDAVLARFQEAISALLASLDDRPVVFPDASDIAQGFDTQLPEDGIGSAQALDRLLRDGWRATAALSGPRCFHFVIGGATPAALGADLLATAFHQVPYTWITSPLGVQLELTALRWLREILELPAAWTGVMVTGATMSNFTCLATARQWWGERHGVDVADRGLHGLPPMPVLTSGYVHASALKALGMLGVGRAQVRRCARDAIGRVDLAMMRRELEALGGAPAVVIVNAGEVNAGDFDPAAEIIALARQFDCWVHVDGAFGMFARVSPRTRHLVAGTERADSVTVDGHKWLNVPYDVGYAFTRDHGLMARAFRYTADYLPSPDDPRPTLGAVCPESSRRARGLATWATLAAYGRSGVRAVVEHCLDLAAHCARRVDDAPNLVRLAEVPLHIVSFRYDPGVLDEAQLDRVNQTIGARLVEDGRVYAGTTRYGGRVAHRPAFSNWRTRPADVDLYVDLVRELGAAAVRELR